MARGHAGHYKLCRTRATNWTTAASSLNVWLILVRWQWLTAIEQYLSTYLSHHTMHMVW